MPIDFFDKEIKSAQDRFNQTFGKMIVCNIKTRQLVMLTILQMARLGKRIMIAKSKDDVRDDIQKFMSRKTTLSSIFELAETERRNYANTREAGRCTNNGKRIHGRETHCL